MLHDLRLPETDRAYHLGLQRVLTGFVQTLAQRHCQGGDTCKVAMQTPVVLARLCKRAMQNHVRRVALARLCSPAPALSILSKFSLRKHYRVSSLTSTYLYIGTREDGPPVSRCHPSISSE